MADVPMYSADETSLFGNNPLTSSLANAALGQDRSTTGTTTQDTNNASTQNTATTGTSSQDQLSQLTSAVTGSTTGSTAQSTVGTTTQNTANTSSQQSSGVTGTTGGTSQTTNQMQNTTGVTDTTGTQRTTGNVTSTATQNTGGTQTITQNADTGALRDVLARQLGGITPEMLQAIFQEGSKAAPNLVVAQAGALGARGVGNSPMAQVLNQLNADLTSKAAALNVQLLSDASGTAGRIADLTKSSTTANQQTSTTTTDQVQDLLTATDQRQMTQQATALVNNTLGSMNQTQVNNQTTTGTQNQASTSTQNQAVTGTTQQNTLQNTAQTQNVSTDATQTQNQLQTGTQTQTSVQKKAEEEQRRQTLNTNLIGKAAGLLAGGAGLLAAFKAAGGAGYFGNLKTFVQGLLSQGTRIDIIDRALRADNLPSIVGSDGSFDLRGLPDVSVDSLLGNLPDIGSIIGDMSPPPDVDWTDLFGGNYADGGELKFLPTPNLTPEKKPTEYDNSLSVLMNALGLGASSLFGGSGNSSGTGALPESSPAGEGGAAGGNAGNVGSASIGNIGQGTGLSNNAAGVIGSIASAITGIPGLSFAAKGLNAMANSQAGSVSAEAADAGMNAAAEAANAEGFGPAGTMGLSAAGEAAMGAAIGGFGGGDSGSSGGGESGNGVGGVGDGVGGDWADGGHIQGPGTGISDSIPAAGPNGEKIRVSNGEYIIPADVVSKFGASSFDKLVAQHHVPADMQRALFGE